MFALTLNVWRIKTLLLMFSVLFLFQLYLKNKHYYQLMKRLKWFYLVMFIIFVFNTPGQHIPNWPSWAQPTYEGVEAGVRQLIRIALILGALSLVLINNNKQELISGLYFLIKPLAYLGLDIQRFSARLWLTLHYVELRQEGVDNRPTPKHISDSLRDIFADDRHDNLVVKLNKPEFTFVDIVAIFTMFLVLIYAIWW